MAEPVIITLLHHYKNKLCIQIKMDDHLMSTTDWVLK